MKHNSKMKYWLWIPAVLAVLAAAALMREPAKPAVPTVTEPEATVSIREEEHIDLGQGLVIRRMDRYSGVYMEDGTDEIVQDVMMLVLENTSERCLQLARIDVVYGDRTAEFEVTSLPAGQKAVLLERGRQGVGEGLYHSCAARNVVFFEEPMDLAEDRIALTGEAGRLQASNRTGEDIPGPVCIYYKNSAEDLFYGGITYRVTIPEGIAAGETVTVPAGHYDPERCRFVQVTYGG